MSNPLLRPAAVRSTLRSIFALVASTALLPVAQAASIYFLPPDKTVELSEGTATFELVMDFAPGEATLGGGIDIDLTGPISFASFTPSAWFTTAPDPAFTGHGSLRADGDYEVHFGNFNGLSGVNLVGTVTVNLLDVGVGDLRLATNTFWGGFYGVDGQPQSVTMTGATVTIVPEPATAALCLLGAGTLVAWTRRRRAGAPPASS